VKSSISGDFAKRGSDITFYFTGIDIELTGAFFIEKRSLFGIASAPVRICLERSNGIALDARPEKLPS
jgi:hypothetical protein